MMMKWVLLVTCLGCEPPREPMILSGHFFSTKPLCLKLGGDLIADFQRFYAAEFEARHMGLTYECVLAPFPVPKPPRRGRGEEARR